MEQYKFYLNEQEKESEAIERGYSSYEEAYQADQDDIANWEYDNWKDMQLEESFNGGI